jgi:hypothetical protein
MAKNPRIHNVVRLTVPMHEALTAKARNTNAGLSHTLRALIRTALKAQPTLTERVPTRSTAMISVSFRMDDALTKAVLDCITASGMAKPISFSEALRQLVELGAAAPVPLTTTAEHDCTGTFIARLPQDTADRLNRAAVDHGCSLDEYVLNILTAYAEELAALGASAEAHNPDALFG